MNTTLSNPSTAKTFAVEIDAEGLLFGLYGVLVCSTGGDERSWMRWAEHQKISLDIRRTHGRRAVGVLREYLPGADNTTILKHLALLDTFEGNELTGVLAFSGVKQLLRSLSLSRWTVVTSAPEPMMRSRRGRRSYCSREAESRVLPKRSRIALSKSSRLRGHRRRATGIKAGKGAGCRVIGVLSSHTAEDLHEADWLVQSIDQISAEIVESATLKLRFQAVVRNQRA